jgi:hypothetical protein
MNESTSFNETQPIKQSANYTIFNNPNEEDQSIYPQINSNSTYMKIAIKYKLPPNFSSIFKISKLGNSYGFCPDVNGDSNILIGPHWYFFIIFFSLFSVFFYFFNKYFIISSNILILVYIERLFYIIWAITYILTSIKNPGYPKTNLENIRGSKQMSYCDKCELWYRPKSKTYHCKKCDVCIEGHKYHCLFTGHCIGRKNKKEFYIFIMLSILYGFYLGSVYYFNNKKKPIKNQ